MTKTVLFVDDEQSLLNGLERRLGLELDMKTACSGDAALQQLEENGPFAVVVTDMQMPNMNGIQFIKHARIIAPDTIYIMLTGNQDLATASQAVNDGKVFRFLNKPCEIDEIQRAVNAGLRQYQLVTGEKDLLQKTFVGAINVLTDVLEMSQPEVFSRIPTVEQTFEHLQKAAQVKPRWEFTLASRLGLIGFALLSDQERQTLATTSAASPESQELFFQMSSIGARLIEKIPRLGTVAGVIGNQWETCGELPDSQDKNHDVLVGANLLRIATLWSSLSSGDLSGDESLAELMLVLPNLPDHLADALLAMDDLETQAVVEVAPEDLREQMVVAKDIITEDDARLVRKGRKLSSTVIEKLRLHHTEQAKLLPIQIYESTCPVGNRMLCS